MECINYILMLFIVMPPFGIAQQTFVASYTIHNTSPLVQEFEVKITSSEYFMLAGTQQVCLFVCLSVCIIIFVDKISCSSCSVTCTHL